MFGRVRVMQNDGTKISQTGLNWKTIFRASGTVQVANDSVELVMVS